MTDPGPPGPWSTINLGDHVEKVSGSKWRGKVVGTYSTELTPRGFVVESFYEPGSVQLYPDRALRHWTPPEDVAP